MKVFLPVESSREVKKTVDPLDMGTILFGAYYDSNTTDYLRSTNDRYPFRIECEQTGSVSNLGIDRAESFAGNKITWGSGLDWGTDGGMSCGARLRNDKIALEGLLFTIKKEHNNALLQFTSFSPILEENLNLSAGEKLPVGFTCYISPISVTTGLKIDLLLSVSDGGVKELTVYFSTGLTQAGGKYPGIISFTQVTTRDPPYARGKALIKWGRVAKLKKVYETVTDEYWTITECLISKVYV